jgi:predicted dehydrogenase
MSKEFSRRDFLAVGAAAAAGTAILGCAGGQVSATKPTWLDQAPDGRTLRAGLIGCGGRGTGAAMDFMAAGNGLEVVAVADVFRDRVDDFNKKLKDEGKPEIPASARFVGFDAYQKLLAADIDVVLIATPPHFRPEHFEAAVETKRPIFMEKPLAVDPVGARRILAASKRADALGLIVACGTQRHHQRDYVECYEYVKAGAIGDIVAANCYWDQSKLWHKTRQRGWSDMEYMVRDWVNWAWLSGDHIVEQHIHNIDVINWFAGSRPASAVGYGARHRRVTGDQYDCFSVDYTYENGIHVHSMCRQINGTHNNVSEWIVGTKGVSNCRNMIKSHDGKVIWEYQYPEPTNGEQSERRRMSVAVSPYVQEHIDMVTAIRTNKPYNEAEVTAISTLSAVMGRISSYTGKEVTWDEMMSSELTLGPSEYSMGKVAIVKGEGKAPIPGDEVDRAS